MIHYALDMKRVIERNFNLNILNTFRSLQSPYFRVTQVYCIVLLQNEILIYFHCAAVIAKRVWCYYAQ
jgi:hypothetical protein